MSKFDNEKDSRLVELYRENVDDLESRGNSSHHNKRRRVAWQKITKSLNNENRTNFTWEQCKKRWQNIKSQAKSSNAAIKRAQCQTGGGASEAKPLSETSNKVIDFLGETAGFKGCDGGVETPVLLADRTSPEITTEDVPLSESAMAVEDSDHEPKRKVTRRIKISEEDIRQKQMEVLNAQMKEFEERAIFRSKQQQLMDKQIVATDSFIELMETFKNSNFAQNIGFGDPHQYQASSQQFDSYINY